MNIIAAVCITVLVCPHLCIAQERVTPREKSTRTQQREDRGAVAGRGQLDERGGGNPLNDPAFAKPKPFDGGVIAEVRKAERVSESEKPSAEETSTSSFIPLPNTMDGLNDKRTLSIGDKLSFRVVEDEGSPRTLSVTDSAEIDVPYIGRVPVGSRTCKQFAYYIKKLLEKEYYYQATVIVGLDAAGAGFRAASRGKVYVMGQVRSPGAQEIPIDEAYTVGKAILRAQGFGPYANKRKVKIVRGGKGAANAKPIFVDCVEILDKGHWDKDVEVGPDDIITVVEKWINLF